MNAPKKNKTNCCLFEIVWFASCTIFLQVCFDSRRIISRLSVSYSKWIKEKHKGNHQIIIISTSVIWYGTKEMKYKTATTHVQLSTYLCIFMWFSESPMMNAEFHLKPFYITDWIAFLQYMHTTTKSSTAHYSSYTIWTVDVISHHVECRIFVKCWARDEWRL